MKSRLIAILAVLGLIIAACGGADEAAPEPEAAPAPQEAPGEEPAEEPDDGPPNFEGQTLRMIGAEGAAGRVLQIAIEEFEARTGATIQVAYIPTQDAINQQILSLGAGSADNDVSMIESGFLPGFIQGVEPLNDWIANDPDVDPSIYSQGMLNLFRALDGGDEIYALPFRVGGRIFIYNERLLNEAGYTEPPTTIEEVREIAEAVTGDGNYGYAGTLQQGNFLVTQWTPWLRSFGGDILDPAMQCAAFNDAAGQASLEWFVGLYRDGLMPPESIEFENDGLIREMQTGRVAMAVVFSGWLGPILDPETTQVEGEIRVGPNIPHGPGMSHGVTDLGGWGFAINRASENKELAWEFIKFLASEEVQEWLALEHGNAPTVQAVFASPDFEAVSPDAANQRSTFETGARQRPPVEEYGEIQESLARNISQALIGDITPQQALERAEQDVNAVLGGNC